MINSMTGFGRAETNVEGIKLNVEVRSVNHRYHEVMFKMPKDLFGLEDQMKKLIQKYVKRGRVDVYITLDVEENPNQELKVDWGLVEQYIEVIKQFNERFNISGQPDIKDLLVIPDLIHLGQRNLDIEQIAEPLLSALDLACQSLYDMRVKEGSNLYNDLKLRIEVMGKLLESVENRAPIVVEDYRNKLKTRITEWLDDSVELDEARLLNEVAFFTDKASIDEELTRLKSHFQQFLYFIDQAESVGRKLDFLIQEMNREVNTIGSKANDIQLSQAVVEMKSELEKMREQVQNVE